MIERDFVRFVAAAIALASASTLLARGWVRSALLPPAVSSLVAMGAVLAVTHLGLASSPWARLCVDTVVYGLSVGLILRGFFPVSLAAVLSRAPGSDRLSGWLRLPVMPVG